MKLWAVSGGAVKPIVNDEGAEAGVTSSLNTFVLFADNEQEAKAVILRKIESECYLPQDGYTDHAVTAVEVPEYIIRRAYDDLEAEFVKIRDK